MSDWIFSNCPAETTGPIAAPPFGSPTVTVDAASRAIAIASSMRARGTSMRDSALQVCPELPIMPVTPFATFPAKAPSSRMMFGLLPPSSWVTRLTPGAAFLTISTPARVDPVKETMSTPGWDDSGTPTSGRE
jgi:hypothetical protein